MTKLKKKGNRIAHMVDDIEVSAPPQFKLPCSVLFDIYKVAYIDHINEIEIMLCSQET